MKVENIVSIKYNPVLPKISEIVGGMCRKVLHTKLDSTETDIQGAERK